MSYPKIIKPAAVLGILVLSVVILVYAKPFLVPLAFAGILSMVLLPVSRWLEARGVHKAVAAIAAVFLILVFFALSGFFIGRQVSDIAANSSKIEAQISEQFAKAQQAIAVKAGVSPEQQKEMLKKQQESSGGNMQGMITGFLAGLGGILTNTLLVLVYIFLFLYFRSRIKGFVLRIVPNGEEGNAGRTMAGVQKVAQKYLSGMMLMIGSLWVLYFIGFTIAGVKNALFFAVLCGLLELVPFVGNLAGTAFTLIMSMAQGGDSNLLIGILITYALVQFIQTYILEPLVVGSEVSINPMFTIIGLVAGEILWGIPGMVLAIPLLGMAKIVCDHVQPLKPYAYLIGEEKKEDTGFKKKVKGFGQKVAAWFK